ncbi:MAG: phosphoadenosine phosphosulfate reductase family protein, partial [Pseudomonadota bacterium]|nr:phosphoadenosine phosphosulfate reductase family protein [Pseudomonadota bacterium]
MIMTINKEKIEHTLQQLGHISQQYKPATFANSFGAEDIVLVDLIAQHAPEIEIFSLDTGRLPQETYTLMQAVRERYPALQFKTYFPAAADVESYVENHGPNGFYSSIELRKKCCHIRKVEPLQRALSGKKAWITGLRKEQGATRENLADAEWDDLHGLPDGRAFSDAIKTAASQHYGHAGRQFLERLTRDPQDFGAALDGFKSLPEFSPDGGEGQDKRAAARFAMIAMAG